MKTKYYIGLLTMVIHLYVQFYLLVVSGGMTEATTSTYHSSCHYFSYSAIAVIIFHGIYICINYSIFNLESHDFRKHVVVAENANISCETQPWLIALGS